MSVETQELLSIREQLPEAKRAEVAAGQLTAKREEPKGDKGQTPNPDGLVYHVLNRFGRTQTHLR